MDEARLLPEGKTYTAGNIWDLPNAKDLDWRCLGCDALLTPWAWEKRDVPFKMRAHFKALKGHFGDCDIDGLEQLIGTANKKLIQAEQGLTSLIPSCVEFPTERPVSTPSGSLTSQSAGMASKYVYGADQNESKFKRHKRRARSIYTTCLCHSQMSFEARKFYSLEVDGCEGRTYFEVFHPLYDLALNEAPPRISDVICYGPLLFKKKIDYEDPDGTLLELYAGSRMSRTSECKPAFKIHVAWTDWSEREKLTFRKDFETHRVQLREAYIDAKRGGKKSPSARVYFIGSQNADDPFLFSVTDIRKICVIYPLVDGLRRDEDRVISEKRMEHYVPPMIVAKANAAAATSNTSRPTITQPTRQPQSRSEPRPVPPSESSLIKKVSPEQQVQMGIKQAPQDEPAVKPIANNPSMTSPKSFLQKLKDLLLGR